jgi:hypothetical protein
MWFDFSLKIFSYPILCLICSYHVTIVILCMSSCLSLILSVPCFMLYFLYALSCMLACNSIAIVYMLFVLGVFFKILFVQIYTKNCMATPFFLVLSMCFLIASSLFDIVKEGGYVIMSVASFMKFRFSCLCSCFWFLYPCLLLSLMLILWCSLVSMHVYVGL